MVEITWSRLPLRTARPFRIATGVTTDFATVLVRAEHGGRVGFGEAAPSARVTGEDEASVARWLARAAEALAPLDPARALDWLERAQVGARGDASARCGLDLALRDLADGAAGRPARDAFDLPPARRATSFTISLDAPEAMAAEAQEAAARGFSALKLKLGGRDGGDAARVAAVRDALPRARLRVDANTAWTPDEADALVRELAALGVELVEQPFLAGELDALAALSRRSPVPVYADESCLGPDDVDELRRRGFVGGVNLKLQKTGGLGPAVEAARRARAHGYGVMVGCNLESGCGIAGARQMLALVDHADLDGNALLAEDPFVTEMPEGGEVVTPVRPGLGAEPRAGR